MNHSTSEVSSNFNMNNYLRKNFGGELFIVGFLYVALVVAKIVLIFGVELGPGIFLDELVYLKNAAFIALGEGSYNVLYPPAYSLVLSPAFMFIDWYKAIILINILVSSLFIVFTWFLARTLHLKHAIWIAIIVSILPFHYVYPSYLLSENLFVPLFVLLIAMTLRGGKAGVIEASLYGLVMSLAHLTKYLMLPAIPLLFVAWFIILRRSIVSVRSQLLTLSIAVSSYVLIMALWYTFGIDSGNTPLKLLGFGISGIKIEDVSTKSVLMWSAAYSAYFILSGILTWAVALMWFLRGQLRQSLLKFDLPSRTYVILVVFLSVGFLALAIQHSFGATYNYPQPQYLIGRYLVLLITLKVVLAFVFLNSFAEQIRPPSLKMYAFLSILLLALIYLSWMILYDQFIWSFSRSFAAIRFNSIETFIYEKQSVFLISLGIAALLLGYGLRKKVTATLLTIAFLLINIVHTWAVFPLPDSAEGAHSKYTAAVIDGLCDQIHPVGLIIDSNIDQRMFKFGLKFFGLEKHSYVIHENISDDLIDGEGVLFVISDTFKTSSLIKEYRINGINFGISRLDLKFFSEYRPKILKGGYVKEKNTIWLQVSNLSRRGLLVIEGQRFEITRGKDGFISIGVREFLSQHNQNVLVYLLDPFTGLESEPFKLSISPLNERSK